MKKILKRILFGLKFFGNCLFKLLYKNKFDKKVALVSCNKWINKVTEDKLLKFELNKLFVDVDIISWQDETIDYSIYDAVIIRSVWGYQDYIDEFITYLDKLKKLNIKVFNDISILKDNLNKYEQFMLLDKYDIPHIETIFLRLNELNQLFDFKEKYSDLVLKPIISGSGNNTYVISNNIKKNSIDLKDVKFKFESILNDTNNYLMVQPFVKEIENGEISVVVIDNKISHMVIRNTNVFNDNVSVMLLELKDMDNKMKDLVDKCIRINEYSDALYMRVDMVKIDDDYKVMELELVEPQLFLGFHKTENQLKNFAQKIREKI